MSLMKRNQGFNRIPPIPLSPLSETSSMPSIVSNQFPWLQLSTVGVKSPQATFTDHHKQDFSFLAPTLIYKVKKTQLFFTFDQPASTNSTLTHTLFQSIFSVLTVHRKSWENPSLGPYKKILNPPSCTPILHSSDSYQKQKVIS